MKTKPSLLAVLLPVAVLAFAGCAGGGDDAPSKDEYIAQADEICRNADQELNNTIEATFGSDQPNQEQIVAFTEDEVIPNLEQQAADLREITPPEGEEDTVNAIYNSLDAGIAEISEDPSVSEVPASFREANQQAKAFGMKVCGSP